MFKDIDRLHFVGIGGAGMSGLAEVLAGRGCRVSGSDARRSKLTDRLRGLGVRVAVGHRAENLRDAQAVVYTAAVGKDNAELAAALRRGLPLVPRAALLGELMRRQYSVGVSGTHGKTTVSSMIAHILITAGADPTAIIGGTLPGWGGGARLGRGDYLVAEACEAFGSFMYINPTIAVVTNIEREHMDYYHSFQNLRLAFRRFICAVPFYGCSVLCLDDAQLRGLARRGLPVRVVSYALDHPADYSVAALELGPLGSSFQVRYHGRPLGRCRLPLPGRHNVSNALAALAAAREVGVGFRAAGAALRNFRNAERRFDLRQGGGLTVVDDYAHHPTEVAATLAAARRACAGRLICIFQPHLYSRTSMLADDFVRSLVAADRVVITAIYAAREKARRGVDGGLLVKRARHLLTAAQARRFSYLPEQAAAVGAALAAARPGDWILTVGAGDIWKARDEILARLGKRP